MKLALPITFTMLLLLASTAISETPAVEFGFASRSAHAWKDKRFRDIIPPDTVKRIVFLNGWVWPRPEVKPTRGELTQAGWNALVAHLFAADETAKDFGLGANEHRFAEMIILTSDGQLFHLELVGPMAPAAVLVDGEGNGARIDIKNFTFSESLK